MNTDDHRDQLIDMMLRELVGGESPPDVRERVLAAAMSAPKPVIQRGTAPVRRAPLPRPAARSRTPLFAVAALFAVFAVAAGLVYVRSIEHSRLPTITRTSGVVDRSESMLRSGERMSTGAKSSAVLTYPDGTTVELAAETSVQVSVRPWNDPSKGLDLVAGRLTADVKPQPPGRPMVLSADDATAEIVGTRLALQHDDQATRLEVTEGAVRFIPRAGGEEVWVKTGRFAESSAAGVRSGEIQSPPRKGILRFTLMNADSDEPLREAPLADGETLSLASLPTRNINIRADYEGDAPAAVRIQITRDDGQETGIRPFASNDQTEPPFFAAGDYWAEGRPNDCREWTPQPGRYRISADASYDGGRGKPLKMEFHITE